MVHIKLIQTLKSGTTRFALVISILLIVLPFGNQYVTNSALTLVLFNSIISLRLKDWAKAFINPIFVLSALFYIYLYISLYWSANPTTGLLQLETKLSLLIAPFVLVANKRLITLNHKELFLKVFVVANALALLLILFIAAYKAIDAGAFYYIPEGSKSKVYFFTYVSLAQPLMHPGYLSTYFGIAILSAIFLFITKSVRKWLWLGLLIWLFLGMILVQGRINILALFVVLSLGGLVAAIRLKRYKWLFIPAIPAFLFVVLLAFGNKAIKARFLQMPDFNYNISGTHEDFNSATYRLAEWTCAADVINQNPVKGVGIGSNTQALMKAYENRGFWEGLRQGFNAHNEYLEIAMIGGFIGLALLILLLGGYAYFSFRNGDYLTLAALTFFALSMITESMLERAWAIILYAVFFPLMLLVSARGATKSRA